MGQLITIIIPIIITVYGIYWMVSMLNYTRKIRIMQSMQLQVLQEMAKANGIDINLAKIAEEVEKTVK